jgi:hypothetical protein
MLNAYVYKIHAAETFLASDSTEHATDPYSELYGSG